MSDFNRFIDREIPQGTGYLYSVSELPLPADFKFRMAAGNENVHGFDKLYGLSKDAGLFNIDYTRKSTPYGNYSTYTAEFPMHGEWNPVLYASGNLSGVDEYGIDMEYEQDKNRRIKFNGNYRPDSGYRLNAMYEGEF